MSSDVLQELRVRQEAARDERIRYLEHRVATLERHRDALVIFVAALWIIATLVAALWEWIR